jgi:GxxExxY protein
MRVDDITHDVIGIALRIHTALGPGLYENVYESILAGKLGEAGHLVERQKMVPIEFEGTVYGNALKLDLLIDQQVILEIKSTDRSNDVFAKQLLTYLRLTNLSVGLVLNFGAVSLKDGIRRVVNNH